MGVYNRKEQQYNINRQFRINNGTVWDKSDSVVFWLRANASNSFTDLGKNQAAITDAGTGHLNSSISPDVKFPFHSLDFKNKQVTVSQAQQADATDSTSLLFAGWVYLNASSAENNKGYCLLHSTANTGFTIFINEFGQLAIRLTNYNSGGTLASTRVETDKKHFSGVKEWIHFAIEIQKDAIDNVRFKQTGVTNIYINGKKVGTNHSLADVGSPGALDPKLAGASYRIGYGPAQNEAESQEYFRGKMADIILLQPTGDLTPAQINSIYTASKNGAKHLGSGFLHSTPFNVKEEALRRQTHPTIARPSNDSRLGNHTINFDDSRAIHLTNNGSTSFPTMLTSDDPTFQSIYSSHVHGQLTSQAASASFGVLDEFYVENNSVSMTPFIESKVYIDSGSQFYQTGTLASVMPGFNQSLKNKQQIQIFKDVSSETIIGSTANIAHDATEMAHWLAYFDFSTSTFQNPGFGCYPSHSNIVAGTDAGIIQREKFIHRNTLAFGPVGNQTIAGFPSVANNPADGVGTPYLWSAFGQVVYSNTGSDPGYPIRFPMSGSSGYIKNLGRPIDTFGFPGTDNYNPPTDGTLLSMSDYINEPFMLEKISVRFKCKTRFESEDKLLISQAGTADAGLPGTLFPGGRGSSFRNFDESVTYSIYAKAITTFLLRQSPAKNSIMHQSDLSTNFAQVSVDRVVSGAFRDIIGYGQTMVVQEKNSFNSEETSYALAQDHTGSLIRINGNTVVSEGLGREQNVVFAPKASVSESAEFEVDCNINFGPKNIYASDFRGTLETQTPKEGANSSFTAITMQYKNNRSNLYNLESVEERRLSGGVNGTIPDKNLKQMVFQVGTGVGNSIITSQTPPVNHEEFDDHTPYLLLPEDKLILGIQAPISNDFVQGNEITANYIKIQPGQIELTLYGSTLSADLPKKISLNQNLGTHTVHEHIGESSPSDQFMVAQVVDLSGSFSDNIVSGSSDATTIYEDKHPQTGEIVKLGRHVGGRASQGTQGETAARKINYRLEDEQERIYDTIMPDFGKLAQIDGMYADEFFESANGCTLITLGKHRNHIWPHAFPFEGRYIRKDIGRNDSIVDPATKQRNPEVKILFKDTTSATPHPSPSSILINDAGQRVTGSFVSPRNGNRSKQDNTTATSVRILESDAIRILYGIGDGPRGSYFAQGVTSGNVPSETAVNQVGAASVINISGFKYGVFNSRPQNTSAVFRRDSYGQFRDMLEPRIYTALRVNGETSFPVEQRFRSRQGQPLSNARRSDTDCSNISTYATSSLPFFDRPNDEPPKNRDAVGGVRAVNISPNFAPGAGPFLRNQ